MKSEKRTNTDSGTTDRWYNDACGTAHALELIGERWALLIIRELMFGPRRFGQLRAALSGLSATVLTARLEGLEKAGILVRKVLPPPASVQVYELTAWGYESEPIFQTMGRWATRSPDHDPTLPLSAASLMLSFRTMLDRKRAEGMDVTIGIRLTADAFRLRLNRDGLTVRRGELEGVDAVLTGEPTAIAAVVYGGLPLRDAEAAGMLTITGSRAIATRFISLFPLPEKVRHAVNDVSLPKLDATPTGTKGARQDRRSGR